MCSTNERNLSINGTTFVDMAELFDKILNRTVGNMTMKGTDTASITLKLDIDLEKSSVTVGDDVREITKPTFKYSISSVMQVKDKLSGQTDDDYALAFDKETGGYMLRKIENGQISFDDMDEDGEYIDADYTVMPAIGGHDEHEYTDTPDSEEANMGDSEVNPDDPDTPFGWLKQFVGQEMQVHEAMGNYTVRSLENKVVLSSATTKENPFYCSADVLKDHVGHPMSCVGIEEDGVVVKVVIGCSECGKQVYKLDRPGMTESEDDAEEELESADGVIEDTEDENDGYDYEDPEE